MRRRTGRVPTGIDRVGLAYWRAVLDEPVSAYGLIRSRWGYILLDERGLAALLPMISQRDANPASSFFEKKIWQTARRQAIGRAVPQFLGRMLQRHVPRYSAYLNVSHANLTTRVLSALKSSIQARIAVMIHDVIPLDFPEFQRAGTVAPFAGMLERVDTCADLVIYNSQHTRERAQAYLPNVPQSVVAHLGTDLAMAKPADLPDGFPPVSTYFVCIGTIEPRKNHAFLLDLWESFAPDGPVLLIIGNRGWENDAVFSRLNALSADGPVRELSGLSDGALAALLEQSAGVLFPSFAEGFGLPATEAAARGVPVIVNDLPVFREILGDIPIYASVSDRYLWRNKINELAETKRATGNHEQFSPPTWSEHFKIVLSLT